MEEQTKLAVLMHERRVYVNFVLITLPDHAYFREKIMTSPCYTDAWAAAGVGRDEFQTFKSGRIPSRLLDLALGTVFTDETGWKHRKWQIILSHKGNRETFSYKTGEAILNPSEDEAMASLLMDACDCGPSFEDWASDRGLSADSRKAMATYEACRETRAKQAAMLPDKLIIELTREAYDI